MTSGKNKLIAVHLGANHPSCLMWAITQRRNPTERWGVRISTPTGSQGYIAGWEAITFSSYTDAIEAIKKIEMYGPDIEKWPNEQG